MTTFSLQLPPTAEVVSELFNGAALKSASWVVPNKAWRRAELLLQAEKPTGDVTLLVSCQRDGAYLVRAADRWCLSALPIGLRSRVKLPKDAKVVAFDIDRWTNGASIADIAIHFSDGSAIEVQARPLLDAVCTTSIPFTQYVGAAPVDQARINALEAGIKQAKRPVFGGLAPFNSPLRLVK